MGVCFVANRTKVPACICQLQSSAVFNVSTFHPVARPRNNNAKRSRATITEVSRYRMPRKAREKNVATCGYARDKANSWNARAYRYGEFSSLDRYAQQIGMAWTCVIFSIPVGILSSRDFIPRKPSTPRQSTAKSKGPTYYTKYLL